MPVLINQQSGDAEDLPQDQADQALSQGTHTLPLNDPQGNPVTAPLPDAQNLLSQGYSQPNSDQLQGMLDQAKYTSFPEQAKAFAEKAASAGTFGLSTAAEIAAGISPTDIQKRAQLSLGPVGQFGASALGLGASALLTPEIGAAGLLGKAGEAVAGRFGAEGILGSATKAAVESALFQAGDENSKFISGDPNQSTETALAGIGMSGLIGVGVGAVFGSVSPLWKAANESKVGQFLSDFKDQISYRANNLEPVKAITDELQNRYDQIISVADSVYGTKGLKAQDIEKLLPSEITDSMINQSTELQKTMQNAIQEMEDNPDSYPGRLTKRLQSNLSEYTSKISQADSPADLFNATEGLKQDVQGISKWGKRYTPADEQYDFIQKSKDLGYQLRTSLEDSDVWGKAAERQQAINSAFSQFGKKNGPLENFESKFTTDVNGQTVIDPGKVNTYYNQLGKPNAEIKQDILQNFFDASKKYEDVINQTHENLGIQSPVQPIGLSASERSLGNVTSGAKAANFLINKGLGRVAGAAVGGAVGAPIGHTEVGALVGSHALGPFFDSVLPALVKPFLGKEISAEAAKTATDLGMATVKGESLLNRASKAIFKEGQEVLPSSLLPTDKKRGQLIKQLLQLQSNNSQLLNVGGNTGYYLPDHGSALAGIALRATQYLNGIRPSTAKQGPLDSDIEPSIDQKAKYARALDIAEQPLMVMKSIKDGNLTSEDIATFHSIYPNLYDRMSQKITNEMISHISKGNSVPYSTRLSLSLFLGQSLDSTMTPQAILAAQPQMPQAQPSSGQTKSPRSKGSMKNINELASIYQTPGQARQIDKQSS